MKRECLADRSHAPLAIAPHAPAYAAFCLALFRRDRGLAREILSEFRGALRSRHRTELAHNMRSTQARRLRGPLGLNGCLPCNQPKGDLMLSSRMLCASLILSLALPACAKKGEANEPESSLSAATTLQSTSETSPSATWEGSPSPPMFVEGPPAAKPAPVAEPMEPMAPMEPMPPMPPTPAKVALTDEQIVGITDTVDDGEIAQAKLARRKAKNARVKKFAAHMISQHTKSKQSGAKLLKQNKLTAGDSLVETDLESKATQQLEKLKSTEPTDFDRAYTESQIAQHQEVLDLINSELIPSASHPDLKAQLEKARGMVEQHLTEAKDIQTSLANP